MIGTTLVSLLERQRSFSLRAFGEGKRTRGIVEHLAEEAAEVVESNHSVAECVDVLILALDLCWRSGATASDVLAELLAKMTKNEHRDWPPVGTVSEDSKINHQRSPLERMHKGLDALLDALELGTHARPVDAAAVIENEVLPAVRLLIERKRSKPNLHGPAEILQLEEETATDEKARQSPFAYCHSVIGDEGGGHVVLRYGGDSSRIWLETLDQDGSFCKVGHPWRDVRDVLPGLPVVGSATSLTPQQARLVSAALLSWAGEAEDGDE